MVDSLIFDLDGTLWQTRDSYLYAYKMLLENHKEIQLDFSDDFILSTMGLTLLEVGEVVFKDFDNKMDLMYECLNYSINYILSTPSTIDPYFKELVNKISSICKLYIVSNCPKEYLDTFILKLGFNPFSDIRYLKDGSSKEKNIKDLISAHNLKHPVFVGDSEFDMKACQSCGIEFAYINKGYRKAPEYDYYINSLLDICNIISYNRYKEMILRNVSCYVDFRYLDSRVTLMKYDDFYLFGFWVYSSNDNTNNILFDKLESYIKTNNITKIVGPVDFSTWFNYRLEVNHFDVTFIPDCKNPQSQVEFLRKRGYKTNQLYDSTVSSINYRLWNHLKKIKLKENFIVKVYQNEDCYNYLNEIYEISLDAFKNHYLYRDISFEDFKMIYVNGLKVDNPDLILIYDNTKPIAFSLCYRDYNNNLYVSKTVAVKKDYQNGKMISKIIDVNYELMEKSGLTKVLYHFRNASNTLFKQVTKHDLIMTKNYELFELKVDKND